MVRAPRVTNPLSRALGAGIGIGALAAAFFLVAGPGNATVQGSDKPVVIEATVR